jgi:hypothetical protein
VQAIVKNSKMFVPHVPSPREKVGAWQLKMWLTLCTCVASMLNKVAQTCWNSPKKKARETSCPYIPYTCLVLDCSFLTATTSFPNHFYGIHQTRTMDFQYDVWLTIVLNPNDQHVVLRAVDMLFLLHYDLNHVLGNIVYVTFFGGIHWE